MPPLIAHGYEKSTTVEFTEDNEVITMSIDQGEDDYSEGEQVDYEDDEEEDHEVSFRDDRHENDASSESEDSCGDNDDYPSQSQSTEEGYQLNRGKSSSKPVKNMTEQERQVKMMELNQEMKDKLIKLQNMMKQGGGMDNSVKEAAKVIEYLSEGRNGYDSSNLNTNRNKKLSSMVKRKVAPVGNAPKRGGVLTGILKQNKSFESESEEMIYKEAVQKRDRASSSSEDFIDTSDELMNLPFEDLQVITNGIVTDSQGKKRRKSAQADYQHEQRMNESPQPTTSRRLLMGNCNQGSLREMTQEEKANEILRDAEQSKERLLPKKW